MNSVSNKLLIWLCVCLAFLFIFFNHFQCSNLHPRIIHAEKFTKAVCALSETCVVFIHLLLTAIHSFRSSPSGSMTACLKFPLPSVASACFSSSY